MRKIASLFFFLLLALFCIASQPTIQASANSAMPNARTTTDGVPFFRSPNSQYFLLFKGYYLEVTSEQVSNDFVKAYYHENASGYARLEGCVKKSDLDNENIIFVSNADSDYFPLVSVTLKIDAGLSAEAKSGTFFVPIDKDTTVRYYGSIVGADGNLWHYVMYDSLRGYLPHFAIDTPVIAEHPSLNPPMPEVPDDPLPPITNTQEPEYFKWILILGISVPALIIVVLLFRPSEKNQTASRVPSFMEEFDELDEF